MQPAVAVLDASALIAFMYDEPGALKVQAAMARGAIVSAVNWAETLSDMAERGESVDVAEPRVLTRIMKAGTIEILTFDALHAAQVARLRTPTKSLGLSLGDRACLALGRLHRLPVLTTDRAWRALRLSIKIDVIR